MKPKTKFQKLVVELSSQIPSITRKQTTWAKRFVHNKYATYSRNRLFCFECGHKWTPPTRMLISSNEKNAEETCPKCKAVAFVIPIHYRFTDAEFAIITTIQDFQVVRIFNITKYFYRQKKAKFDIYEVVQHFVHKSGKSATIARLTLSNYNNNSWNAWGSFELRNISGGPSKYHLVPSMYYPQMQLLDHIKRNGFNGEFYDRCPATLFSNILTSPKHETLLKSGQHELFRLYIGNEIKDDIWKSIKVCIRNKYFVEDVRTWLDHLNILSELGKDTLNHKYICPQNLDHSHKKLIQKAKKVRQKIKIEKLKKDIAKSQIAYQKAKGKFLDLEFKHNDLVVRPIATIEDFLIEGDELNHCLFSSRYYENKNSLVFSARLANQRIETVEFDLKRMEVVQARGVNNKASEFNSQIINLINSNKRQIASKLQIN